MFTVLLCLHSNLSPSVAKTRTTHYHSKNEQCSPCSSISVRTSFTLTPWTLRLFQEVKLWSCFLDFLPEHVMKHFETDLWEQINVNPHIKHRDRHTVVFSFINVHLCLFIFCVWCWSFCWSVLHLWSFCVSVRLFSVFLPSFCFSSEKDVLQLLHLFVIFYLFE